MTVEKDFSAVPISGSRYIRWPILAEPKRIVFYLILFLVFCFSGLLSVISMQMGIWYLMGLVSAFGIPLILLYGVRSNKRIVFYLVFFLVFCFSGLLYVITAHSYRTALVSALVIPLVLLHGIRVDRVFVACLILTVVVGMSALYNQSSLSDFVEFMRVPVFSYLIYYLVEVFIDRTNIAKIVKLCIAVSLIQLPMVLLQWFAFDRLPARWTEEAGITDFGFGTFSYKADYAMAFFLCLLVIFLLFDRDRSHIIRHRWAVALWLTLTILIANAQMVKPIVLLVWGAYLIRHLGVKTLLYVGVASVIIIVMIELLSGYGLLTQEVTLFAKLLVPSGPPDVSGYLSGSYSRFGALQYFLDRGITLLGDGPSRYFDVFSRTRYVGNAGHFFTFYSEIGLLGWLTSVVILFWMAFPGGKLCLGNGWVRALAFLSVNALTFTSNVMNDISVMLIYCIVLKTYLIPAADSEDVTTVESRGGIPGRRFQEVR